MGPQMLSGKTNKANIHYLKIPSRILLLLLIPAVIQAAISGDYEYTDNGDNTCTITAYTGPGGDITIPETLNGLTVTVIGDYAFAGNYNLTGITIGNSVTIIGAGAFQYSGLTNVTIGNNVTTIGYRAFLICADLSNITLGNSVTAIGDYAFYSCSSLTNIVIPESVTTIGEAAFLNCNGLAGNLMIPDSVTMIGARAFSHCINFSGVTIGNGVTTIGDEAFRECSSLTALFFKGDAPSLGLGVFSGGVTATVYYLFGTTGWSDTYGGLPTSLWCTFSDNGDGTCTIMRCGNSGDIILPETLNGLTVTTIADDACAQCYGLTGLTISRTVINIEQGAFSPSGLTNITVVPSNPAYSSIDGVLFNKTQTELIRYPDRKAGDYMIPNSVTVIGHGAFSGCDDLTSVNIQDGVISIGDWAFALCSNLTGLTVVPANSSYSSSDGVLFNKTQTDLIQYPPGKAGEYTIPNSVTTIRDRAFYYCSDLTGKLTIPDSVTAIGDRAFFSCSGLTNLTIGNGIATIGSFVFGRCDGLTNLKISSSVTTIGENAFFVCDSLTSVIIPAGVTNIAYRGFYDCGSLTAVYFKGQPPVLGTDVFRYVNATAYYIPGTAGWGEYYGGLPTAEWPPSPADADLNYEVDIYDFSVMAGHWMQSGCNGSNDWCQWADFDTSGSVDPNDLLILSNEWLFGLVPF